MSRVQDLTGAAYRWTMSCRAVVGFLLCFSNTLPVLGVDGSHWPHGLDRPLAWASREATLDAEYYYVMTAKLRLLFFWVGRDDLGGGYIRLRSSKESPVLESIDLKMDSDPDKAPRGINRWGAATEMVVHESLESSGAFFGFWKAAKGESKEAVELELSQEESEASPAADEGVGSFRRETWSWSATWLRYRSAQTVAAKTP